MTFNVYTLLAPVLGAVLALQPAQPPAGGTGGGTPAQPGAPKPSAPAQPATPPAEAAPADPALTEFLSRLERANASLTTLQASMRYIKVFPEIEGADKHVRTGVLYFHNAFTPPAQPARPAGAPDDGAPKGPRRAFAVDLTKLVIDNGGANLIVRDEVRRWAFDGVWLLEVKQADKQWERHRIVGPGSTRDPLRIGEGPLPLPIGQRPADMLRAFDLSLLAGGDALPASENATLRKTLEPCTQLVLIPKPGTRQARNFREIRIWYRADDLLPLFARTVATTGGKDEILLSDLRLNAAVDGKVFDTTPPQGPEWKGNVNELREAK